MSVTLAPPNIAALSDHMAKNLKIRIIGAGIGGLACGLACAKVGFQDVTILESVGEIAEVGAGLQTPPNETRIFRWLGVLEELRPSAVALEANSLRREWVEEENMSRQRLMGTVIVLGYSDNVILGTAPLMPGVEDKYGAPLWVAHRADVQRVLRQGAEKAGVKILTSHKVEEVDFEKTRFRVNGMEWEEADVIIAADGEWTERV